ncbi:MAG: LuxR family transcriptional regulator [Pirellulales bacterium]|nr:LuxR family transcriptional regulator [Pirellulales bacterium]
MAPRHLTTARDDPSRPPMFSAEEWRRIVHDLALSPRQAEVIGHIMQSKTDKEIAAAMQISKATIRTYIDRCKQQLDAFDRVGLACRIFEAFRRQS